MHTSFLGRARALITAADARQRAIAAGFALLAAFTLMNLAIHALWGWSSVKTLQVWLLDLYQHDDSWSVMLEALAWIRAHPDAPVYEEIFFRQQIKFQYFPTSLLPLLGLEALGFAPSVPLLNAVNRVLVLLTVVGAGALALLLAKRLTPDMGARTRLALAGLAALSALLFYPILMAYYLGQLQVWINALFMLASIFWVLERRALAGLAIGLICLLKPQFGLFALWGLLRRDWRFLFSLCLTAGAGVALSVAAFGLHNHVGYLGVLQALSRHGEAYLPNFSFNGLLHRLTGNDDGAAAFDERSLPPFHPVVYGGTLVTSLAILAIGLWPPRATPVLGSIVHLHRAALAFTLASPIAWEHHYGVTAPMFVALFCHALAVPAARARGAWMLAIAIAYGCTANALAFTNAFTGTPLAILQSYTLFAGLAVLAMLWRLGRPAKASSNESAAVPR